MLCAPVDLLFNGGVGTFVKASDETHAEVGDKTNDRVRVQAGALRCKVVAEGGNLGLTQRARIEYAQQGGRVNTDAIDAAIAQFVLVLKHGQRAATAGDQRRENASLAGSL